MLPNCGCKHTRRYYPGLFTTFTTILLSSFVNNATSVPTFHHHVLQHDCVTSIWIAVDAGVMCGIGLATNSRCDALVHKIEIYELGMKVITAAKHLTMTRHMELEKSLPFQSSIRNVLLIGAD